MPTCPKCQNVFSRRATIDGVTRVMAKRKYCLDCSPFGEHNTRKIHAEAVPETSGKCQECNRVFDFSRNAGHRRNCCNTCWQRKRRARFQAIILSVMGPGCWQCGYAKARTALHQHHIDPAQKSFSIGGSECRTEKLVREELAKCAQLCANCHCEVHEGLISCPESNRFPALVD